MKTRLNVLSESSGFERFREKMSNFQESFYLEKKYVFLGEDHLVYLEVLKTNWV